MFGVITKYAKLITNLDDEGINQEAAEYIEYLGRWCEDRTSPNIQLIIRLDSDEVLDIFLNDQLDIDYWEFLMMIHEEGELVIRSASVRFAGVKRALPIPLYKDTDS